MSDAMMKRLLHRDEQPGEPNQCDCCTGELCHEGLPDKDDCSSFTPRFPAQPTVEQAEAAANYERAEQPGDGEERARDCGHGQLARSCPTCELEAELRTVREERDIVVEQERLQAESVRKMEAAIAKLRGELATTESSLRDAEANLDEWQAANAKLREELANHDLVREKVWSQWVELEKLREERDIVVEQERLQAESVCELEAANAKLREERDEARDEAKAIIAHASERAAYLLTVETDRDRLQERNEILGRENKRILDERDEARALLDRDIAYNEFKALEADRDRLLAKMAEWRECYRMADADRDAKDAIIDALSADKDRLAVEVERLREYARHAEGCSAPYGYPCKCGLDDAHLCPACAGRRATPKAGATANKKEE